MALDHGTLNIPLSKRGNIDAQIDRYKADQARAAKTAARVRGSQIAQDRIAAKVALAAASDEKMTALAGRLGVKVSALRKRLASDAHWDPKLVLGLDLSAA